MSTQYLVAVALCLFSSKRVTPSPPLSLLQLTSCRNQISSLRNVCFFVVSFNLLLYPLQFL